MKLTTKKLRLIAGFALAAICMLVPALLQAQELRGKITGRVTDASGAVIPGATVKVTDVARAATSTLTTNEEGLFDAPYLLPGTYQVVVELAGFKKALEENVQVTINDTRVLNIKLDVGNVTETVSVTETASLLTSADADLGNTIDRKRVDELPSIHGDPYALIASTPGVTYTGSGRLDRPFEPTHIVGYAMAGTRGNRSDLLIDGAPSTATANANEVIASYVPPTDITQEFKVQTATYDSQFGNTEGGVTSIVIKSGTNNLHGTAYIWTEPGGMAANDFFGNARGQARPFSYSNRPGFNVNGPVYLPGIYDGRNKTFFLFSYEGIRDSRPRFDASNIWVPTDALKNGDFSAYLSNINIYDPLTGAFSNGTVTNRSAFTNNIIPGNRINSCFQSHSQFLWFAKESFSAYRKHQRFNAGREDTGSTTTTRRESIKTSAPKIVSSGATVSTLAIVRTTTTQARAISATDSPSFRSRLCWMTFIPLTEAQY